MNKVKLGTVADMCLGKMLDAQKNKGEYEPYLANINVRWGDFSFENLPLMRFEPHEQERYGLEYGDLVMCEGGEPGRCAIWRDEVPGMKIQKALHRIRPRDCLDVEYLYYWFLLAGKQGLLNRYFTETTIKHLPGDSLKDVEIDFPNLSTQRNIGAVLSAIDAKIRHNNFICAELESIAKTIYDYWFTQFDFPNAEGEPYRSSSGKMVWNKQLKKEIPEGWKTCCISDIASQDALSVNPQNYGDALVEHYSIPAFDDMHFPSFEPGNTIESNKYIVYPDSILTSKLNPQFKRLWDPYCQTENAICSTEFLVYRPKELWMRPYCYAVLDSEAFYRHMVGKATSSTGSRKRIQPDVSAAFQFALPPETVIQNFVAVYSPIMEKQKAIHLENNEFSQLRDWLLPLLMNGQATVE